MCVSVSFRIVYVMIEDNIRNPDLVQSYLICTPQNDSLLLSIVLYDTDRYVWKISHDIDSRASLSLFTVSNCDILFTSSTIASQICLLVHHWKSGNRLTE